VEKFLGKFVDLHFNILSNKMASRRPWKATYITQFLITWDSIALFNLLTENLTDSQYLRSNDSQSRELEEIIRNLKKEILEKE
jgi:hypothetical protein